MSRWWIEGSTQKLVEWNGVDEKIRSKNGREIHIDVSASSSFRKHGFFDTWKVATLYRYNPLIFFTVYDQSYIPMVELSIKSLVEFGQYDGDILIVTNLKDEMFRGMFPKEFKGRWSTWTVEISDVIDVFLLRYQIHHWSSATAYQPIFYSDSDIIFDAPIQPMLIEMAMCTKPMGQGHRDNALSFKRDFGLDLFNECKVDVGSDNGVCTGTFAISNVQDHERLLNVIVNGTLRYKNSKGFESLPWQDQPSANFYMYMLGGANGEILDRHVRWGGRNALQGGVNARGLVHLWGGAPKIEEMQDLYDMFSGTPGRQKKTWAVYEPFQEPVMTDAMSASI